jgi:lipopolysaccharide transport system ATP-binding protein
MLEQPIVVDVDHVTIRYNLDNQKGLGLKEFLIDLPKRNKRFQEFLAVKDVSFQVRKGEAWGLVGQNGSGKSTLLKAISGIIRPYKGSITTDGSIAPLLELGAGFHPELTARENVYMNGCILGHSRKFMEERFDEIIKFAELSNFVDTPLKNFSSGMRARLGFSIATLVKPDILILDEVLSVGDYKFRKKCEARIKELLSGGTTLLFVSHNANQVVNLCDHALWLKKGEIAMIGESQPVCDAYMAEMNQ